MKILLIISLLFIAFRGNSQSIEIKMGDEACECFKSLETKSSQEEIWESFNSNCWIDLMDRYEEEIKLLFSDSTTNESTTPEYIRGYQSGTQIGTKVISNLIMNCDEFYELFQKMIPVKIAPNTTPIYGEGEIDSLSKYIDIGVNPYNNYCDRAIAYYKKGKTRRAIADIEKAIELQPNQATPYIYRGIINRNRKDYCEALPDFERAFELSNSPMLMIFSKVVSRECVN